MRPPASSDSLTHPLLVGTAHSAPIHKTGSMAAPPPLDYCLSMQAVFTRVEPSGLAVTVLQVNWPFAVQDESSEPTTPPREVHSLTVSFITVVPPCTTAPPSPALPERHPEVSHSPAQSGRLDRKRSSIQPKHHSTRKHKSKCIEAFH